MIRRWACLSVLAVALHIPSWSAAQTGSPDIAGFYEDALVRYEEGDRVAAALQLKNVIQAQPAHRSARILLAKIYLEEGFAPEAEDELLKARELGADESLLVLPLAEALLAQAKFRELITNIRYTGYRPSVEFQLKIYQGQAHTGLTQYDRALRAFDEAERLQPNSAEPAAGKAVVLVRRGAIKEAEAYAARAVELGPESADAWNARGSVNHAAGRLREALSDYGKVLEVEERHIDARIARAGVALDLNELAEASDDIGYLRTTFPGEPRSAYLQSVILNRQGDEHGAKAALSEATQLLAAIPPSVQSRTPALLLMGGIAHFNLRDLEKAEIFLNQYLERRPRDNGARRLLASVFMTKGWLEDAIGLLRPVVSDGSRDPRVYGTLADAYFRQGRSDVAEDLLKKALEFSGNAPEYSHQLALAYIELRRPQEALDLLSAIHQKHPTLAGPLISLITLRLARREYEPAIALARNGIAREPDNQNLHNLLGVALTRTDQFDDARQAFDEALALGGSYLPARINLAKLDVATGDPASATQKFEALAQEFPEHADTMLEFGTHLANIGNLEDAILWSQKGLAANEKSVRAVVQLVDLFIRAGDPEKALAVAKDAETWAPEDNRVLTVLARSYIANRKPRLARAALRQAATDAGFDVQALLRIAQLQADAGAWEDADWSLQKLIQQDPTRISARVRLVEAQLMLRRFDRAKDLALAIKKDFPKHAAGEGLLGEVASRQGKPTVALKHFQAALALDPSDLAAVSVYRAMLQAKDKRAGPWLQNWVKGHPSHDGAKRALAEYFHASGQLEKARDAYVALINTTRGRDPYVWNNLAQVLLSLDDPEALTAAQRAKALAPDDASVNDTLGWLHVLENNLREGLALLRTAQSREAENPEIRYHIGVALHRLSRKTEALRELEYAAASKRSFPAQEDARRLLAEIKEGTKN